MAEFVCNLIPDYPDVSYDSDDYSGECLRRERVVRCRDCAKSELRGRRLYCKAPMGHVGYAEVCEDDFCSCGEPREVGE